MSDLSFATVTYVVICGGRPHPCETRTEAIAMARAMAEEHAASGEDYLAMVYSVPEGQLVYSVSTLATEAQ